MQLLAVALSVALSDRPHIDRITLACDLCPNILTSSRLRKLSLSVSTAPKSFTCLQLRLEIEHRGCTRLDEQLDCGFCSSASQVLFAMQRSLPHTIRIATAACHRTMNPCSV